MATWPSYPNWRGFWNMGRPVKPLPPYVTLVDRVTGVDYYLSQTGSPGSMALSLVPWTGLIRQPFHDYGMDGGPFLNGIVKLYVANGALAGELIADPIAIWDPRIFTRDAAFGRHLLEITAPLTWKVGDPFIYTELDI